MMTSTNAASIIKKLFDLRAFLYTSKFPDVIVLAKTWFNAFVSDSEVPMEGYKLFYTDLPKNRPAGGVAIFIKYF